MNLPRFIIVDDDALNNMICRHLIKKVTAADVEILDFLYPEKALEYIATHYSSGQLIPTVLLLDINMPKITGWDFLDIYSGYSEDIRKQLSVYVVSSSVDTRDKQRAADNIHVKNFLEKPLTPAKLQEVLAFG